MLHARKCAMFNIADDLTLMAPTRAALQTMIDISKDFCDTHGLAFNTKKSKVMLFGKSFSDNCLPLYIGDCSIDYVKEWKYLGTT